MRVLLRKSIADVTRRKGRAILMILGILIGIMSLTAVNVANEMLNSSLSYGYDPAANPDMAFDGITTIPTSFLSEIKQLPTVSNAQLRYIYVTTWHVTGSNTTSMLISGYTDWQHLALQKLQLISGRWPQAGHTDEIMMDVSDTRLHTIQIGNQIQIEKADGSPVVLHVVGITRTAGQFFAGQHVQSIAYMDADGLQQLAPPVENSNSNGKDSGSGQEKGQKVSSVSGTQCELMVKATDAGSVRALFNTINQKLQNEHIAFNSAGFRDPASDTTDPQLIITGLFSVVRLLAIIALLLVCMMIINTVTMLLTEQIKVIGTMKAIGGTQGRIIGSYLLSISIYGILGTGIGLGLGLWLGTQLAVLFADQANIYVGTPQISSGIILISLVAGLLIPLLAALWPLFVGTRITVQAAIRDYGVQAGSRRRQGYITGRRFTWLSQTALLGIRSIFRKPGRASLTLLALTLSGATFTAVQITNASIGSTVKHINDVYVHDDVFIDLGPTVMPTQPIISNLNSLANIVHINAIDEETVTTSQGAMQLIALPASTTFYQPELISGRWLHNDEANTLVVSDQAAQRLKLQIGDHLAVKQGNKHANWQVVGIVHDVAGASGGGNRTGPIGIAFTTLKNVNNSLKNVQSDTAGKILIQARNNSLDQLLSLRQQIKDKLSTANIKDTYVSNPEMQDKGDSGLLIVYILFYTIAVLVALAGLLGLSNTLSASVLERRLEIGILRSLGATGRKVCTVFWIEGLSLALLAWCLGVALGIPGSHLLLAILSYYIIPLDTIIDPRFILLSLLFVIIVACIASIGPVLGASRLRIRDILRYE